jgi:hypothetical protein
MLAQTASIQNCDSRWFLSWPNLVAACLYSCFVALIVFDLNHGPEILPINWTLLRSMLSSLAFGLAAGFARERSQSILPACLLHVVTAVVIYVLLVMMR